MGIIPFYGANDPDLFALERAAMDRPGRVLAALDRRLPEQGTVVDIGAGDGFTAERLSREVRSVIPLEPAEGMRRPGRARLRWVAGEAERLPFRTGSFDGGYATWAFFFAGAWDLRPALAEVDRVVRRGSPIAVVDNLGDDEFTQFGDSRLAADTAVWDTLGFDLEVVDTEFSCENEEDARLLLTAYFGANAPADPPLTLTYRVGVFSRPSRGPTPAA